MPSTSPIRIQPHCSVCDAITSTVDLTSEEGRWRLVVSGLSRSDSPGTFITDERAARVTAAAEIPYDEDRFWSAGLDEDCGYCIRCPAFYCKDHWKNGWCPRGHLMSLSFW